MNTTRITFLFMALALWSLFTGCERPFLADDLNEKTLALSATFSPGQGFLVFISPVTPFNNANPLPLIEQADVRLSTGGVHLGNLQPARLGDRPVFYLGLEPQANIPYTLDVRVPGYPALTVTDRLPLPAAARFREVYRIEKTGLPQGAVKYVVNLRLEVEDRPILDNYYHLFVEARMKDQAGQEYFLLTTLKNAQNNDPSISPYVLNESLLLDGRYFDGLNKELDLQCQFELPQGLQLQHLAMDLRHVSFPYYQFHLSHYAQLVGQNNGLSEPVQLYSNVPQGRGFFGGFVSTRDSLKIE